MKSYKNKRMPIKRFGGNSLFWKISAVFAALLTILGIVYIVIASQVSRQYFMQINQRLYGDIASNLVGITKPLKNGHPDTSVTHDIMHSIMVMNPSAEVYLLDTDGKILDYVVPGKTVKTARVRLDPVKKFLDQKGSGYVTGDNPRAPGEESVFSAAPIYENGRLAGYAYAVLASEKERQILAMSSTNLFFSLGTRIFIVTLIIALIVGLITFFLITDSVRKIAAVVSRFKSGDQHARIEGNIGGNLGLLTSSFNEMADTIVENIHKITETDRLRQELIANVSHDLRTPLSILQGYVETLLIKKGNLTEAEEDRYLKTIMDSSKKLSSLVEQLFQYSKLEANQIQPHKEAFLLDELASDMHVKYELLAKEKGVDLQLVQPGYLPPVFADLALTERVLQNLLDNALKFTPSGGQIKMELLPRSNGVEVVIADTGIGISHEDQLYIFDRHKQMAESSFTTKGMGLGLAIVKKILDLHNVNIHVQSTLGSGSSFWFELPVFVPAV
jgi:signal transduction histidine kinase